jgi:hypothetical protein
LREVPSGWIDKVLRQINHHQENGMKRLFSMFSHKSNRLKELKMKRLLSIFSLAAMLLLGLATPHAASAATITCQPINPNAPWPGGVYTQYCSNTSQSNYDQVYQAVNSVLGSQTGGGQNLLSNSMISLYTTGSPGTTEFPKGTGKGFFGVVYLFHSPADYTTWASANKVPKLAPSATGGGITILDASTFQAYYTAVFEQNGNGLDQSNVVGDNAEHEVGHWLDYLLRGADKQSVVLSNSAYYQSEINTDWSYLNVVNSNPACRIPHGNPGVFTGRADFSSTGKPGQQVYYICNGSTGLTGYSSDGQGSKLNTKYFGRNKAVLQSAWAYFFKPGLVSGEPTYAEIWAQGFAATFGPGDGLRSPANVDVYYGGVPATPPAFECTSAWINYVAVNGYIPTKTSNPPANFPSECPLNN